MDTLSYKTISANKETATKEWVVVDATDQVVGRFGAKVAKLLRGKYKPNFTPHVDCGDNVIIINADKVKLTGNKWNDRVYLSYTGYPGGQREMTPAADDADSIMDKAEKMILEIASNRKTGDFTPINQIVIDTFSKIENLYESKGGLTGLSTGFKDLDKLTAGLQPSDLILVAARPSMGKTAFTLNIASHVALKENKPVAFFSLEMSKEQLMQRMLCAEGLVESQRLRVGDLDEQDWQKLIAAADKFSKAPLYIDDTPGISIMELRSKARRLQQEKGLSLVLIDYLQLMQGRANKNGDNRQQEISEISRSLKSLARELNVPVIALSQLSRSVESRQIKKPMLSDLRESGSLEQDADIVMFLYREDYYNAETENKNITDVIVAKHRNGPVDTVQLFFHKEFTKFADLLRTQDNI